MTLARDFNPSRSALAVEIGMMAATAVPPIVPLELGWRITIGG